MSIEREYNGLTAHQAWELEAQNLRELSHRNHNHLVRRIANVTHGERLYRLYDWTSKGDLKNIWEQQPEPLFSPKLVSEVIAQLRGLASAIKLLHDGYHIGTLPRRVADSSLPPHSPTSAIIDPDVEFDRILELDTEVENSNWRHGDLKPENILRFLDAGELIGTLRISDLGLAKRHIVSTGLRKLPSLSRSRSQAYEPPEAVTMPKSPSSRLYDIWSFGCIMLEFVVWLLYGHEGLKEFWNLPIEPGGTRFWTRLPVGEQPGAEVNHAVTKVMERILATHVACQSPSALHDLLLLIRDRVLVPALPNVHELDPSKSRRIHAGTLLKSLEEIENKCKSPRYCCPSQPELGARLPTASRNASDSLIPPVTHGNELSALPISSGPARVQRVNLPE